MPFFFSSGLQRELLQKEEELKAKTADIERLIPNSQISESTVTCPDHMENVSAYFFLSRWFTDRQLC